MKNINLNVITKSKSYPIIIGKNIIYQINNILKLNHFNFEKVLLIADTKIPKKKLIILKSKIKSEKIIIHPFIANERNKSFKSINLILEKLFKYKFNRNDCIISFGGGAYLNPIIRKKAYKKSITIWLDWNPKTLINRIRKNNRRPIASNIWAPL